MKQPINPGDSGTPRFVCDDHMGKLARYLRVAGFDTVFDSAMDNNRLIQISLDEKRHILTRDRRLIERRLVRYYLLLESERWQDQIRAVADHFGLVFSRSRMFTRCLEDNAATETVAKEDIRAEVWPYTYEHHDEFRMCPQCRRIYWAGSHVAAMYRRFEEAGIEVVD
jgi:uncharacterized protein with PIN domain